MLRGQRAWCSPRRKSRPGCATLVTIIFQHVLPRHSFTADLLWGLLGALMAGGSIHAAWLKLRIPLSLQATCQLLHRARDRLGDIRSGLLRITTPPKSRHNEPLVQAAEHLRCAFPQASCPVSAFQLHFQAPILG